jgi:hypothetical protein
MDKLLRDGYFSFFVKMTLMLISLFTNFCFIQENDNEKKMNEHIHRKYGGIEQIWRGYYLYSRYVF